MKMNYEAIVIGLSSGGLNALKHILPALPADFCFPIIIVQHRSANSENHWIESLNERSHLCIREANEKEVIEKGSVYFAPANYHLLVEKDGTLSLSIDEKVNYARPSIDVLFETAAEAYKNRLIGIVLTGSSSDGSIGLKKIKDYGGLTIIQDPATAESPFMPSSALSSHSPDYLLSIEKTVHLLLELNSLTTTAS